MPAPDPALRKALEERERFEGREALARELAERSPETAERTDLKNPVRVRRALERLADPRPPIEFELPPFRQAKFVLDPPQPELDQAIAQRAQAMLPAWTAEVNSLLAQGVPKSAPAFRAIGYQSVIGLVEGALSEDQALTRIVADTRNYAKRQRTWTRTEPRATTVPTKDGTQAAIETITKNPVFE
jgi:tRNA dimethylallyltransferase